MGNLNEEKLKYQKLSGIISEGKYEELLKQIQDDQKERDAISEANKEYLSEAMDPEQYKKLLQQVKDDQEVRDEIKEANMEYLSEVMDPEQYKKLIQQVKDDQEVRDEIEESNKEYLSESKGLPGMTGPGEKPIPAIDPNFSKMGVEKDLSEAVPGQQKQVDPNKIDPAIEKAANANIEKAMQLALGSVQKNMVNMAKNQGDKDGVLDIKEDKEKWAQDVDVKKGTMHKVLGIPEDKRISDVYTSGEELARALINKVGREKAAGMINFRANVNSDDNVFDKAQRALSRIEEMDDTVRVMKEGFKDFLVGEYSEAPSPDEIGEAIINWASNYMMGDNDGDFEGVKGYLSNDVWEKVKDQVPSNFMNDMRSYAKNYQSVNESDMQYEGGITIKEEAVNEAIGALMGSIALSAPAIVQMAGKATKWIGKKVDANWLKKAGEALNHFGHAWHHKYEDLIYKAIKKLNPQVDDKKAKNAAKAVLISVIGTMAVVSGLGAADAAAKGATGFAGLETGLAGVKTGEVVGAFARLNPQRIATMIATAIPTVLKIYFEPENIEGYEQGAAQGATPAIA